MERKELKPIYARFAQEWIEGEDGDLYIREEADAVMDAMEKKIKTFIDMLDDYCKHIKELEQELTNYREDEKRIYGERLMECELKDNGPKNTELFVENATLRKRIRELEADNKTMAIQLRLLADGCMPSGNAIAAELAKEDDSPATISFLDELEARR